MELHEQCIDLSNEFEIKYINLSSQRKDVFGAFFREAEEQENAYKDAVTQKIGMLLEQAKEGGSKVIEELDDDSALLLGVRSWLLACTLPRTLTMTTRSSPNTGQGCGNGERASFQ